MRDCWLWRREEVGGDCVQSCPSACAAVSAPAATPCSRGCVAVRLATCSLLCGVFVCECARVGPQGLLLSACTQPACRLRSCTFNTLHLRLCPKSALCAPKDSPLVERGAVGAVADSGSTKHFKGCNGCCSDCAAWLYQQMLCAVFGPRSFVSLGLVGVLRAAPASVSATDRAGDGARDERLFAAQGALRGALI